MSYATAAPGQQAGTVGSSPPTCQNCSTSTTPLWRRDESGSVLCNACGLFLKLHGRSRPSSLKTDVIKSRNRVKTLSQGKLQKKDLPQGQGLAAAHPDLSSSSGTHRLHRLSDSILNPELSFIRSDSPSVYPSLDRDQHPSNIAPQHLFDGVALDSGSQPTNGYANHSPYLLKRPGSPTLNGHGVDALSSESSTDLRVLLSSNTSLKTRVSELEVINELFRGRVNELESTEAETSRRLDDAIRREQELRSKIVELEALIGASNTNGDKDERPTKRMKTNPAAGADSNDAVSNSQTSPVDVHRNGTVDSAQNGAA